MPDGRFDEPPVWYASETEGMAGLAGSGSTNRFLPLDMTEEKLQDSDSPPTTFSDLKRCVGTHAARSR
jgi:hypothetical protein